ncbi:hypothetical protein [Pedobacter gandavensis]|uniref:hypothetical protein n=1 Tax=Pedobacter gandavensis TaxID=2679963 RepID=UPI00292DC45F|nr:hypothetical protein [Pedobacter gandavensis]
MKVKYKMSLFIFGLFVLMACKKGDTTTPPEIEVLPPTTTPIPTDPTAPPSDVPADATIIELGRGEGEELTIDGGALKVTSNAFIKIKGGRYSSIVIKNIVAPANKPFFIKNDGIVKITNVMHTSNINNVVISGDNVAGQKYGFQFENISFRAIMMDGKMNGVTIRNMSFKNVNDYVIAGEKSNGDSFAYKGTAETRTENFKIINCLFENAGSIAFGGNLNSDTGEDSGLFKNVEVAYNTFINSADVGTLCSFSNVQDYDIHHNIVNNINAANNNHNGIFYMQGNGNFHDNKLSNYQGNSIRMWLYSRGSSPATNEIYNNICYNTRKYGAFELQAFTRNIYPGKSTYANAKVYNNTAGKMNTSHDFEGQVLDLYNTFGSLEYYNNLGFDLNSKKTITNMINNMSDTKITRDTNNKYVATQAEAVFDTNTFQSKYTGIGAPAM